MTIPNTSPTVLSFLKDLPPFHENESMNDTLPN